jgi:hypothetical protein
MDHPLDRPVWNALTTWHAAFAQGGTRARCYPPELVPLGATHNDPDRQKPGGIDLLAPVAQRWRDAATALMDDPEAPLPSMED